MNWEELTLRFAAFSPVVSTVIVGTSSIGHLPQNKKYIEHGPLQRELFRRYDVNWLGQFSNGNSGRRASDITCTHFAESRHSRFNRHIGSL